MTGELKTLMDQATERGTSFAPDVTELVAAGRHRTRRRRVMLSAATAVGTATAVVAVLLVGRIGATRTEPLPAATAADRPAAITDLCAKSDDFFRTANDDAWRRQVVTNWTDKVVEVTDADGAMTVRRSPDGSQYAYCVAGVPIQGQPLGGFGSALLNVGIVTRGYQIQRYWSLACGNAPVERSYKQSSCRGVRYSYAGRVPEGVTRIAFTGLGQRADAAIKDGYWVHRVYTDDIRNSDPDPIYISMYDASGKQVFKERY
ncbi:hypothetical protein [Kribbella soli]|uniref:Uncharacterized protein n=1 Tax=Kribbella soli TaxID=1124743 RepID=A0A4R0HKQ3_9ACTN|nr:hypothetical protein [Kribbella soli]TCC10420.1 hypothetical protein E0H45_03595 [Kribbella soli]